jgi:hypothetical protein
VKAKKRLKAKAGAIVMARAEKTMRSVSRDTVLTDTIKYNLAFIVIVASIYIHNMYTHLFLVYLKEK